ncbi:TPA: hypothetical protein ACPVXW_000434 [Vibrio parahaemolyticus]
MYTQVDKPQKDNSEIFANSTTPETGRKKQGVVLLDNRIRTGGPNTVGLSDSTNPIQRYVYHTGDFREGGRFHNYYKRFSNILNTDIFNDRLTDLIVTTEDFGGVKYGNTKCEIEHRGVWYDIDNTEGWSRARSDAKARIIIRIDGSSLGNLNDAQVIETLVHEWECHGKQFYQFINKNFRHKDIGPNSLLNRFDERNAPGGYLNVNDQHGLLYRSNRTTEMDKSIAFIGNQMPLHDARNLYDEYATDVSVHKPNNSGHVPTRSYMFDLESDYY